MPKYLFLLEMESKEGQLATLFKAVNTVHTEGEGDLFERINNLHMRRGEGE